MARGAGNSYDNTVRMLNLVALLSYTEVPLSIEDIANRLDELDPRFRYPAQGKGRREAFNRDKKALIDIGVPIVTSWRGGEDAGVGAYMIDKSEYAPANYGLTDEEMDALQAAAALVQIDQPWLKSAIQWLGGAAGDASGPAVARLADASPELEVLWAAVRSRTKVAFTYHGVARTVRPYGIANHGGMWYVVGVDETRGAERNFRVDRIEGGVATAGGPGSFERPTGFDIESALVIDPKLFGSGASEHAVVRVDANLAANVVAELGADSVVRTLEGTGAVEVKVPCGNYAAFCSWLFAMVDRAEVVGPAGIRERIIADLTSMAEGS
ncbi:MAG: helix-turn-helix transcriptional regulator [Acidimicrobiales bacterium]